MSRESLDYLMDGRNGPSNAAIILPGGAVEALEARPGSLTLNLKKRKGFIRTALRNGYGFSFLSLPNVTTKFQIEQMILKRDTEDVTR